MLGITKGLVGYIRRRKSVFETLSEKEIEESLASLGVSQSNLRQKLHASKGIPFSSENDFKDAEDIEDENLTESEVSEMIDLGQFKVEHLEISLASRNLTQRSINYF